MPKLIYHNFDKLEITFQGVLPAGILAQLNEARNQAQQEKREVPIELGSAKMPVMVAETGAKGGYKYRFNTGIDGEIWFVSDSKKAASWGIRVSVSSLSLALYGYEGAKERILNRLIALGAIGPNRADAATGRAIISPIECISRFDYCFDFIMEEGFALDPACFVAHQRFKRQSWGQQSAIDNYSAGSGEKINTLCIGKMPGRQATIYNKTAEIKASDKAYWWDMWEIPPEDRANFKNKIWRLEVRAGKNELTKWQLKRFADFEKRAGDAIASILKEIRYVTPAIDTNRARWPVAEFWQQALDTVHLALAEYRSNAARENIVAGLRQSIINNRRNHITGSLIGYLAALGRDVSELANVIGELEADLAASIKENPENFMKKFSRAEERFRFLD